MNEAKGGSAVKGTVRVTLPAKIAYDPEGFKRSVAAILEEIGCPRCFSGANCVFENERRFVMDPEFSIMRRSALMDPEPDPWMVARPQAVNVMTSGRMKYDIDKVLVAIDKVIDLVGGHPCISGLDFYFRDVLDAIVVNDQAEAVQLAQQF